MGQILAGADPAPLRRALTVNHHSRSESPWTH